VAYICEAITDEGAEFASRVRVDDLFDDCCWDTSESEARDVNQCSGGDQIIQFPGIRWDIDVEVHYDRLTYQLGTDWPAVTSHETRGRPAARNGEARCGVVRRGKVGEPKVMKQARDVKQLIVDPDLVDVRQRSCKMPSPVAVVMEPDGCDFQPELRNLPGERRIRRDLVDHGLLRLRHGGRSCGGFGEAANSAIEFLPVGPVDGPVAA
jgi:hypothetical protein